MHLLNKTEIEDDKACPTGDGTRTGYRVEVRCNYHQTKNVMGMVLDNRWREVPHTIVHDQRGGIPLRSRWRHDLDATGCLEHYEAEALRWWFICAAHASEGVGGGMCIETRLVAFKIRYSYSATPTALIDAMDGRGDMPDDMQKPETATLTE